MTSSEETKIFKLSWIHRNPGGPLTILYKRVDRNHLPDATAKASGRPWWWAAGYPGSEAERSLFYCCHRNLQSEASPPPPGGRCVFGHEWFAKASKPFHHLRASDAFHYNLHRFSPSHNISSVYGSFSAEYSHVRT